MRKRANTVPVDAHSDLDFTVLSFVCRDPSVHRALGLNTKEVEWKVQCRTAPPLRIKALYDKNVLGRTEVRINCNDQKIFPAGSSEKARLIESFSQTWPFRGLAKGINEKDFVEVRLHHQGEKWFPATVRKQLGDGFFEVMVRKEVSLGVPGYYTEELHPMVNQIDLRVAATKQPYAAQERQLVLTVPSVDPLQGTQLTVDTGQNISQYFGRPTPHAKDYSASARRIQLTVKKDRSLVTGSVGHRELLSYWSGDVRAVEVLPKRPGKLVGYGSKLWKIMVGLCEHVIEVERRHTTSKHITVTVDDEILIEALAEDIDWQQDGWCASFRFVGDPILYFDVNETDRYGNALDSIGCVEQKITYSRVCVLNVSDISNLSTATLTVDDVEFRELPLHSEGRAQGPVSTSADAMVSQYNISVPYKVNKEAASHVSAMMNWASNAAPTQETGWFAWCSPARDKCCCTDDVDGVPLGEMPRYNNSDVVAGYHATHPPDESEGVPGYDKP